MHVEQAVRCVAGWDAVSSPIRGMVAGDAFYMVRQAVVAVDTRPAVSRATDVACGVAVDDTTFEAVRSVRDAH